MNHFGLYSTGMLRVNTDSGENVNFYRDQRAEYPIYMIEQTSGLEKSTSGVKILFHVEPMQIKFYIFREQARANSIRSSDLV